MDHLPRAPAIVPRMARKEARNILQRRWIGKKGNREEGDREKDLAARR